MSLTEAGKVLLDHASHIVARLAAAKADLDAMAAGDAGVLRVGTFQSASARLLPPTLAAVPHLVARHQRRTAQRAGHHAASRDLIRSGQADLAFADIARSIDSHAMVELIRDPEVLITAPDHPLAQHDTIDLAELDGVRMISMPTDDVCAIRTSRALERVGAEPDIVFRSDDNLTTQRLVAIGLGVAIVPLLTVERSIPDARVAIRGLNTNLDRQIGIIWHRDRLQSRAAEAFIETAMQISSDVDMPAVPSMSSPSDGDQLSGAASCRPWSSRRSSRRPAARRGWRRPWRSPWRRAPRRARPPWRRPRPARRRRRSSIEAERRRRSRAPRPTSAGRGGIAGVERGVGPAHRVEQQRHRRRACRGRRPSRSRNAASTVGVGVGGGATPAVRAANAVEAGERVDRGVDVVLTDRHRAAVVRLQQQHAVGARVVRAR